MCKKNIIIRLLNISMIILFLSSCNHTDNKSDYKGKDSTISNSKKVKTDIQELVLCPVCKGTKKCIDCNGTAVAIYYEGSTQQCVGCNGTGICNKCNTPEKRLKIKKEYQTMNKTNNARTLTKYPRKTEQIQIDLDKSNKLLMVLKGNLSKFEANKESLDLQSQYRQIIIDTESQIQKLQQELSMAQ